jgi:hypothetical protein
LSANIWLGERAQHYSREVTEARDVKSIAVDLKAALQTAESSQRGYLYTNNEIYLSPYDLAKERARNAATTLPSVLASYPEMHAALTRRNRYRCDGPPSRAAVSDRRLIWRIDLLTGRRGSESRLGLKSWRSPGMHRHLFTQYVTPTERPPT